MTQTQTPRQIGWFQRRAELKRLRQEVSQAKAELERLQTERESLLHRRDVLNEERRSLVARRRELLAEFGEIRGRKFRKMANFERHLDVPSFVVGQRMLQRIHRRADDHAAGIDGAGALFADPEATAEFVTSHGLTYSRGTHHDPTLIVHAFHGEVGLIELRSGMRVRHLSPDGADPGDIRAAFSYDADLPAPARLSDIVGSAETLSDNISRPYVQISYSSAAEVVAVDVDPDRIPVLADSWDQQLGTIFDRAHARTMLQPLRAGALANRVPGGIFEPTDTRV